MKPIAYFLSEETLKERTVVSAHVDTKLLNQAIWDVQERVMQPILGTTLYNRLVAGIDAEDLTAEETTLLEDYLTNAMLFYVIAELPYMLGYKFHNKNVLKKTAENAEAASMSELADVMKYYMNKAEFYEQRAIVFLKEQYKLGIFPEYAECYDMPPNQSGYRCGIVL